MPYITRRKIAQIVSLEEIFLTSYSAADLITFFSQFKVAALTDPEILQKAKNNSILNHPGKMLKRHNAAALQEIFQDKKLALSFFNQQSDLCQSAMTILAWHDDITLKQLEELLKKTIATLKTSAYGSYAEPFTLENGLELLFMENQSHLSYKLHADKKEFLMFFLPSKIKQILREILPEPAEYYLSPLKRKSKTDFRYSCESSALMEISRIIKFIKLGHLPLKKNGQATAKGLRDLVKIAGLQEFYQGKEINNNLLHMKSAMLATLLLAQDLKAVDISDKPQNLLCQLFRQWLKNNDFTFIEQFLEYIRRSRNKYAYYYEDEEEKTNIKKNLLLILKEMPAKGWVSCNDILSFSTVRKIKLLELDSNVLEYRHYEEGHYSGWVQWESINQRNISQIIYLPLLKSFFFLAAALGLVEIGYNIPKNPNLKQRDCEYLSKYDGMQLVKLTKLGAYVIGKTKKYTAVSQKNATCQLQLDTTRLLLTMEGSDPIASLNLQKVLEPAGTGRYMLTYGSLLKNCQNKKDVQDKIDLFKDTISQTAPKIWQDFFKKAIERVDPLKADPGYRLFKIEPNQELLHTLTSDPEIAAIILKVEGMRIAVELPHLSKLTRLLKKHGYLISNGLLSLDCA